MLEIQVSKNIEMIKSILTALLFFTFTTLICQDVYITEICSSNSNIIEDQDGDFSDWIELYNNSDNETPMLGHYLSDNIDDKYKWSFPDVTIPPKSYLIIFASGKDKYISNEIHSNFKISMSGEEVILTNTKDSIISFIPAISIPTDYSYSRIETSANFDITNTPTPSAENQQSLLIENSHSSGFYTSPFKLELKHSHDNHEIRYTTNGDNPNENSLIYSESIDIINNTDKEYSYSSIPTTPQVDNWPLSQFIWKQPQAVNTGTVIRYALFENNEKVTTTQTLSFWVDENINDRYSLPVLSLVTDSLNLFDYETGIYIPGKFFDDNGFNWFPTGNYHQTGKEWERSAHISYYSKTGTQSFETNSGIRMKGYGSAANPQKSMNIFFRKEYGQEQIEADLFNNPDKQLFNRFVIRNSGNDFINTHFRDGLLQSLISDLDLDLQDFQPAITFINGEYWGIYNIRDKYDEYYFSNKYNIDKDDVNLLGICGSIETGTNESYTSLLNFVGENDLSEPINYKHVQEEIELDNFIDFMIAEIYYANYDWPCNNFKVWKPNTPGSKWRFVIYDLDLSFNFSNDSEPSTKSLEHATSEENGWPYCQCSNSIFRNLLANEEFTKKFIERFTFLLENNFDSKRVIDKIEEIKAIYQPEMQEHIDRWNYPSSISKWEEEIESLNDFALNRPCFMKENIIDFFDLDTLEYNCLPLDTPDLFLNLSTIHIYPSISDGKVILRSEIKEFNNEELYIYNILGELVFSSSNFTLRPFQEKTFDLSFLTNGIYTINITHQESIIQERLIINK